MTRYAAASVVAGKTEQPALDAGSSEIYWLTASVTAASAAVQGRMCTSVLLHAAAPAIASKHPRARLLNFHLLGDFPAAPQDPLKADRSGELMHADHRYQQRLQRDIPLRERPSQHGRERDGQSSLRDEPQPPIGGPGCAPLPARPPRQPETPPQTRDPQSRKEQRPGPHLSQRGELQVAAGERKKYDIDRYRAPFELTSDTLTLAWCGVTQGAARRERDQDGVQTEQTHGLCNDKGENHEHQRERATNRTQVLRECEGDDQRIAEGLVRGQWKPGADREDDEDNDGERQRHRPRHDAQQRRPPRWCAQRVDGQLAAGGECNQRQRPGRDDAQRLQFRFAHDAEPRRTRDEAREEIADDPRYAQPLRDHSRQRRGKRHAPEGECRLRLGRRSSERAREALQHCHDDERDEQQQPLHERAKYGRFSAVTMPFVHLHTHSEYSLLDGANRIPDLLDRVQALGMDSLAITDHGNLHGAWSFYAEAKARKIRPILGFEAYLAFGSRHAREKPAGDAPLGAAYSHLILLAKNRTGYQNLIKLSSIGFLEGYYRRPRIDKEVLEQHREGIIGLAA